MLSWKGIRFSWFKTVITSHKYILAWVGRLHKEIAALPTPTILLNNPAIKKQGCGTYIHSYDYHKRMDFLCARKQGAKVKQ